MGLVSRFKDWNEINHFGRKGKDGGVDIHAVENVSGSDKTWFIQCKRYDQITKSELEKIVNDISGGTILPNKLLLIISCDLSRNHLEFFKNHCSSKGIAESEVWTAATLEAKLYKDYKDLLFAYFGVQVDRRAPNNENKIKHSIKIEKRLRKELLRHDFLSKPENSIKLLYDRSLQFKSARVIVRSVDDTTYPNCLDDPLSMDNKISPWFRTHFYDFDHDGIELWIDVGLGSKVIMDDEGWWEPVAYNDERLKNSQYRVVKVKVIAKIPFYNIVDFKPDGDGYYQEPHLFCRFANDGTPYSRTYYRIYGDQEKDIPDWDLDEEKMTKFPK